MSQARSDHDVMAVDDTKPLPRARGTKSVREKNKKDYFDDDYSEKRSVQGLDFPRRPGLTILIGSRIPRAALTEALNSTVGLQIDHAGLRAIPIGTRMLRPGPTERIKEHPASEATLLEKDTFSTNGTNRMD